MQLHSLIWQVPPRTRRWLTVLTAAVALLAERIAGMVGAGLCARHRRGMRRVSHRGVRAGADALRSQLQAARLRARHAEDHSGVGGSGGLRSRIPRPTCRRCRTTRPTTTTAINNVDIFLAGKIVDHVGGLAQVNYDGTRAPHLLEHARLALRSGLHARAESVRCSALSLNNSPTVQDPWNSTPIWQFPFPPARFSNGTQHAAGRRCLRPEVLGRDRLHAHRRDAVPGGGRLPRARRRAPQTTWASPIRRTRAQAGRHGALLACGAAEDEWAALRLRRGLWGFAPRARLPSPAAASTDNYTDIGYDATYQFANGGPHTFNANASYIHENQRLFATALSAAACRRYNHLNTLASMPSTGTVRPMRLRSGTSPPTATRTRRCFGPGPFSAVPR